MGFEPSNPHDSLFRGMMSRKENAAGQLRAVVARQRGEAVAAQVDWDNLTLVDGSFVTEDLRNRHTDLLFRTTMTGRDTFVYVLTEHQSSPDRLMAFRMLVYIVGIWNRYLDEYPNAKYLPVVIPLVVHSGPNTGRWNKPLELLELIDVDSAVLPALEPHVPRLQILLDDLGGMDAAQLRARPDLTPHMRVTYFLHKVVAGNPALVGDLREIFSDLKEVATGPHRRADLEMCVNYIRYVGDILEADFAAVFDQLGPEAREVRMTNAERLKTEGIAEGIAEGEGRVLLKLLGQKFGELPARVVETVRAADVSAVDVWIDRVLTAHSLDEVFAA